LLLSFYLKAKKKKIKNKHKYFGILFL
jgi:hypothetical protein